MKQPFVPSCGPDQADIVLVGEAPGAWEVKEKRPFVGDAGQVLDKVLAHVGFNREDCFITNVVCCRPPGNAKPEPKDMEACNQRLVDEIRARKPKLVVIMGNTAISGVLNIANPKVTAMRGRLKWSPVLNAHYIITFHPASLLYAPMNFPDFVNDMMKARATYQHLTPGQDFLPKPVMTHIVNNEMMALRAIKFLGRYPRLSCDIETSGFNYYDTYEAKVDKKTKAITLVPKPADDVLCISFSYSDHDSIVFAEEVLDLVSVKRALIELFARQDIYWLWHNGKFDIRFLRARLGLPARVDGDTMLKHYAIDERRGIHGLKDLAQEFCDAPDWEGIIKQYLPNKKSSYRMIPTDILYNYAGYDTAYTWRLDPILTDRMAEEDRWAREHGYDKGPSWSYYNLLVPASNVFTDIESGGIGINVALNRKLERTLRDNDDPAALGFLQLEQKLLSLAQPYVQDAIDRVRQMMLPERRAQLGLTAEELQKRLNALENIKAGIFNPRSPVQVQVVLYDCLNLPKPQRGKDRGKRTTNKKWLDYLKNANPHPFIDTLLEYRKVSKLLSTYVDGIAERIHIVFVDGEERWIYHPDYRLHGTITGRLAEPVIVLIPRKQGGVKKMFEPVEPGWVLVQADYSQAELRTLAVFSDDPFLKSIYFNDKDLHDIMSVELYGPNFTSEDRVRTKAVNFGIPYGREAYSIAMEYNMSPKEAQALIDRWLTAAAKAKEWIDAQKEKAKNNIPIVTPLGRIRRFGLITDENWHDISKQAVNAPIQSTASDLTLKSLIDLHNDPEFRRLGRITHCVHDSIVVQCPIENVRAVVAKMKAKMESVPAELLGTDMPFKADFEVGPNWGTLTKYNKWLEDNKLNPDDGDLGTIDIIDEPVFIGESEDVTDVA
jgi:DNA polymerase-1